MLPSEVLAVLPQFVKSSDSAPVRDAIVAMLVDMYNNYDTQATYTFSQADPDTATGIYLRGFAQDHRIPVSQSDFDADIRGRIFAFQPVVTPIAILTAIQAAISGYTTSQAQLFESELDCLFITDGTATYDSFIGTCPRYGDRLYPDDSIANGGYVRANSDPGNAWIFADQNGRFFIIRLPNLAAADGDFSFVNNDSVNFSLVQDPIEMFISDGTNASGSEQDGSVVSFVYQGSVTSDDLYNTVVAIVDRLKPQGFRYEIWVDA